jgi:hypothetical protein
MRPAKLLVSPSFAIAKNIASNLSILESNFKAAWQWLSRGLQKMFLHREGTKVNKNDLEFLIALKELYEIIVQYDLKNIYNMDETDLFFNYFWDTYTKWQFMTCSTTKSWTLKFLPKNAYLTEMCI